MNSNERTWNRIQSSACWGLLAAVVVLLIVFGRAIANQDYAAVNITNFLIIMASAGSGVSLLCCMFDRCFGRDQDNHNRTINNQTAHPALIEYPSPTNHPSPINLPSPTERSAPLLQESEKPLILSANIKPKEQLRLRVSSPTAIANNQDPELGQEGLTKTVTKKILDP